jgi:hypothetical protein
MPGGYSWDDRILLQWLSRKREQPQPSLLSAKHIALKLNHVLMRAMHVTQPIMGSNCHWDGCWLENFPAVQTFDLCIDPGDVNQKEVGSIILYQPLYVPVTQLSLFLPSAIQEDVTARFEAATGNRQGGAACGDFCPLLQETSEIEPTEEWTLIIDSSDAMA